ncbi:MAG: YiiG family protein [Lachnospiraceae bacterium]|jgi:hypothetical protein|nr:YiiG family protein [Lachnospiraceae bacterium]
MMKNGILTKTAAVLLVFVLALAGCGKKAEEEAPKQKPEGPAKEAVAEQPEPEAETASEEDEISPEQMELIKFNYYVDLNNDIIDILDSIHGYYMVVDYTEEFSLLPDTGLPYGYDVYGKNTDILDDCLMLSDMEPAFGELDDLVKEMEEPLRALMETFSAISDSYDYADNQYQKAKEYHAVVYENADIFTETAYDFIDAVDAMGIEKTAKEEERMKEEGMLIIYNASRAISIAREVQNEVYAQEITDENITDLDLTEIKVLYDELVAVVADFDAATADNDQLIKESLSNSRPFDGLYDSLIQALEWMIKQVESGTPLDLSGSGAPLGSFGHFSETLGKCIDRYNSVFVD